MKRSIVLLCLLLAQMVSAQRSVSVHTSFCSGNNKPDVGGDFINPDSISFSDKSTGPIVKWEWKFSGAKKGNKDSILVYTKYRPTVSVKWSKSGNYKVELTTFNSKGQSTTLGVVVIVTFVSTAPEEKKPRKDYLSLFVGPTTEFIFPTQKGKSNETFLGGMTGLIIKPHGKWTSNITFGYFFQSNVGELVSKKFTGLYTNIMVPVSKKGYIMFGPEIRVGKYTQGPKKGFAKVFGFQMNYLPKKNLTPKGSIDLRMQIASSVNVFDVSDVSAHLMILFDFGLK